MKFTKTLLASAIAFTIAHANANDWTVNAVIKNETAVFSKDGSVTGNYNADSVDTSGSLADATAPDFNQNYGLVSSGSAKAHSSGDTLKSETSARIFVNGSVGENASLHAELRPVIDTQGANDDYKNHEPNTQQDYLRELYVDTTTADGTYIRAGKQQVVWGKADGAKFLDLINPTDYREMAQNAMDESRITVWALNAEKILDNGATIQAVISQPKENVFAGLNRNIDTGVRGNNDTTVVDETLNNGHDSGHAFILLGPDTITGNHNGFLNIVPDLGSVATRFAQAFSPTLTHAVGADGAAGTWDDVGVDRDNLGDIRMTGFTVGAFSTMQMDEMGTALAGAGLGDDATDGDGTTNDHTETPVLFESAIANTVIGVNALTGAGLTNDTITGATMLDAGFGPFYNTNLSSFSDGVDNSAFEYMRATTFLTFDSFVNAKSQYVVNMPENEADLGFKYAASTPSGMNYSAIYSYNYDKNPIINLSWRDSSGNLLYANRASYNDAGDGSAGAAFANDYLEYDANGSSIVITDQEGDLGTYWDSASTVYDATNYGGNTGRSAILRFEQTVERVHNIGGGFDFAVDSESMGPVVIRGEFVYTKDGYQPVLDKSQLAIGNMTEALKMEKADRFKYVLGADVTVLTDMMLSAQFIQERNLDYVNQAQTCTYNSYAGAVDLTVGDNPTAASFNCDKYTASYANMSLNNGFAKDIENKEFYSLFLSKPFGESGEGRWNNILMLEEGGGRWNRFDVEYSLSNEVVGTFEVNKYWGDANSQFGQLENSSNVQVGLKYIIE